MTIRIPIINVMPILYMYFKLTQEVDMDQLLCLHAFCGQNVQVSTMCCYHQSTHTHTLSQYKANCVEL